MMSNYGFDLLRDQEIPELHTYARLWRHSQTGAELLSLENDDDNKVFGISFRTPPDDSTGVAHILEHCVLCGSRKYPLKKPFVELLKGSLKTFLNAFTYPDKTCYPVASQNLQDFYNLIDVYLDAVFYPRLTRSIFEQEAWHYELTHPDDPLVFKGVVFNEMKGAYASPERLISEYSRRSLFPDTTYGVSSGGDPQYIPDLTYAQLTGFHRAFYHPSNARIFFSGNDDPAERLRRLDAYLSAFQHQAVASDIPLQPYFDTPRWFTQPYSVDPDGNDTKKAMTTVNWLLNETTDAQIVLGLNILTYILVATPASPLRKALIDSGLGDDLIGGGLSDSLRQAYFSTGLKGIAIEDAPRVEALIMQTLADLVEGGIEADMVAAALNTIEFRLRENNPGAYPRGLILMLRALDTWLYDGDPFDALAFAAPLEAIKTRVASGERYFENLIASSLLHNPHRTTMVLQPDPALRQREVAAEQDRLAQVRATLSQADIQAVIENTQQLKQAQETPDPPEILATMPMLTLADIDRHQKEIARTVEEQAGVTVLRHDLITNGILYLDVGFNLDALPQELVAYVPLFGQALLGMGTEREDFVQVSQRIGRTTGGIYSHAFSSATRDISDSATWLFLRGKAVITHVEDLLNILRDVLLTVRLDNPERFRQIVLKARAGKEAGIIPSGHAYVGTRLRAHFNRADWVGEQMSGISQLFFLRELEQAVNHDWPTVLAKLEQIRQILVNREAMLCNVTVDGQSWESIAPTLSTFLSNLPSAPRQPALWTPAPELSDEGLTIPSGVNYVGKAANLYELGYHYHGSVKVITKYLRNTWLWEKVRIQGGAYGSFCGFDRHSGILTFTSYRDPNVQPTLDVYNQAGSFLRDLQLSETERTRAIIGTISDVDAYQLPDAQGYTSLIRYVIGETDATLQQRRDEILATTTADFHTFADVLDRVRQHGRIAVLGTHEAIQAVRRVHPGHFTVTKVL